MTVVGPFSQSDFRTMQMLKENIKWYKTKDHSTYGDVVAQYHSNLREYFQKVA